MTPFCTFPAREFCGLRTTLVAEITRFEESGVSEWPVQLYAEQLLLVVQLRLSLKRLTHLQVLVWPDPKESA